MLSVSRPVWKVLSPPAIREEGGIPSQQCQARLCHEAWGRRGGFLRFRNQRQYPRGHANISPSVSSFKSSFTSGRVKCIESLRTGLPGFGYCEWESKICEHKQTWDCRAFWLGSQETKQPECVSIPRPYDNANLLQVL
jgi:hypothetical protein